MENQSFFLIALNEISSILIADGVIANDENLSDLPRVQCKTTPVLGFKIVKMRALDELSMNLTAYFKKFQV